MSISSNDVIAKLDEEGLVRVSRRRFKSTELVDIRKFYLTDDDEMKPGRQGLSLTLSQWDVLVNLKDKIDNAFEIVNLDNSEVIFEITCKKRATVEVWKKSTFLDLREFYEKDGEMRPGKKGIKLSLEMWNKLRIAMEKMSNKDDEAETKKKRDREDSETHQRGDEKRLKTEEGSKDITTTTTTGNNKDGFIALNEKGTRRFTKRMFKGVELYDIREYYEAGGEMKPGRKGISLKDDQWKIVISESKHVNELLTSSCENGAASCFKKNESGEYFLEISKTRRLTVREWKGKTMVDIREFYEKEGRLHPGKKGISLSKPQWDLLVKKCF